MDAAKWLAQAALAGLWLLLDSGDGTPHHGGRRNLRLPLHLGESPMAVAYLKAGGRQRTCAEVERYDRNFRRLSSVSSAAEAASALAGAE